VPLNENRFFDPDPSVRRIARELYDETRALPIVSPHGHVDPRVLADDHPFPEPTALIVLPDHYILRMLYSQGVPMEKMGIGPIDGNATDADPRAVWQILADHFHLFRGTPTAAWLSYELHDVFGVKQKLDGDTAQIMYDEIAEKLASAEYRPRALFDRFNVEVLATTDSASDPLDSHRRIATSEWQRRVIPTFRPDALFRIAAPGWKEEIQSLAAACGSAVNDYSGFIQAIELRRAFFRAAGATATDHGVEDPHTERLRDKDADRLFLRAHDGVATPRDERHFVAHMLMEMARMSAADGMVMQLHAGALRDHNRPFAERFGPDKGADIPVATEFTRNLRNLLSDYGNDPRFRVIIFTLDESTYSRELAPLAGHYPAARLGPPWWFHDSISGMSRFRECTMGTAGVYNTAGFNDDTRAFCSIPARHDLSRRVDANWLAGLVARHIVDIGEARDLARALARDLAIDSYRLGGTPP